MQVAIEQSHAIKFLVELQSLPFDTAEKLANEFLLSLLNKIQAPS
jgi:hypothetical protein